MSFAAEYETVDVSMVTQLDDVISAISTPIGVGGIGVVRLSGKDAVQVADKIFRGSVRLSDVTTHTAHFGHIANLEGNVIDEVVALAFKAPHSYTGENVVEISCHGGILVTRKILQATLDAGARLAEPGEFTKRAFLNGRMDLSQAEAVADLIHSKTDAAHRSSLAQLEGTLSKKINRMRDELVNLCSLIEVELDFAEEDLEFVSRGDFIVKTENTMREIQSLIESFEIGKVYREGVKVVIAGKPNAGKSSILNALLQEDRVIVSEIPGTTRDTIEENLTIAGVLFRLVDTAGLRDTVDRIEREGVRRAERQLSNADIILLVVDSSEELSEVDSALIGRMVGDIERTQGKVHCVVAMNKIDLVQTDVAVPQILSERGYKSVKVSATTGTGLNNLRNALVETTLKGGDGSERSVVVTNVRHRNALERAWQSLSFALKSAREQQTGDFIAADLRAALDALGEIVGVVTTDDILNNIFSKFCIGK
jgi:tRNA modification GTPase